MKRRILNGVIGALIFIIIGFVFGLITGMYIGGNFFTEFEFGGVRGYEAAGNIGAITGAAIGLPLGALLGVRRADRRSK